ncbi:hypothetical protein ACHAXT_009141 [Thalassiosira profunda]
MSIKVSGQDRSLPIAIVGASYSGLCLANVLHLHSIPCIVFEGKALPFNHVVGGSQFNVPSYQLIAKKLKLGSNCISEGGPTRKEVVDSLLRRVLPKLMTAHRVVGIESKDGLFHIRCRMQTQNPDDERIVGPFRSVVGADGVLSTLRSTALKGTYLIGDARWCKDRWWDLGLQRIDRGADMALMDGCELGEAIVNSRNASDAKDQASKPELPVQARAKFGAFKIARRQRKRQLAFLAIFAAAMLLKSQGERVSANQLMLSIKHAVFGDDCLSHYDEDSPMLKFRFHDPIRDLLGLHGSYGVLIPNPFFWIQMSVLILIQSIVAVAIATTIYYGIIQLRGSTSSYLLCWGAILPFAVTFPFYLILEESLRNYCLYYSSVIEFVFDANTRAPAKATRTDILEKGKGFLTNFVVVSMLLSFMESFEYRPFDSDRSWHGHIGNNFLSAVLTSSTVATGTAAFGFGICALVGIQTLDVFDSPLFKSQSVSDFWGRRWNRLVHGVLKRGVYKPVRKHFGNRTLASLAAFVMSGLLHEYILLLVSTSRHDDTDETYRPVYGSQFCFFAWNGMLMAGEYLFVNWAMAPRLKVPAPPIVKSLLIILLALPVSHWFTDQYVNSGLFSHYAVGFPVIVRLE